MKQKRMKRVVVCFLVTSVAWLSLKFQFELDRRVNLQAFSEDFTAELAKGIVISTAVRNDEVIPSPV